MASLELWFAGSQNPQLVKTVFHETGRKDPHSNPRIAHRGKTAGAFGAGGSFLWTSAVQALSVLLLRAYLSKQMSLEGVLSGESGSAAASLDYAISKQPTWLVDMFGTDAHGRSLAGRLIRRTNSEQKREGPVILSINPHFLDPTAITIFIDQAKVIEAQVLLGLLHSIEIKFKQASTETIDGSNFSISSPISSSGDNSGTDGVKSLAVNSSAAANLDGTPPFPFSDQKQFDLLKQILRQEITSMVSQTDIFDRESIKQCLNELIAIPWSGPLRKRNSWIVDPLDTELSESERLGVLTSGCSADEIKNSVQIRFATSPTLISSVALFKYLKMTGINIQVDYHFSSCREIVQKILKGNSNNLPNACVLTAARGVELLDSARGAEFYPLMLLPKITHRVVAPRSENKNGRKPHHLSSGTFSFWSETPSGSTLHFEKLKQKGLINPKKIEVVHSEPNSTSKLLREGSPDMRAILWFPFYQFNELFNNCEVLNSSSSESASAPQILFVHQSIMQNKSVARWLDVAIRDAWLTFRENPSVVARMVDQITAEPEYIRLLARYGGIYNMIRDDKQASG